MSFDYNKLTSPMMSGNNFNPNTPNTPNSTIDPDIYLQLSMQQPSPQPQNQKITTHPQNLITNNSMSSNYANYGSYPPNSTQTAQFADVNYSSYAMNSQTANNPNIGPQISNQKMYNYYHPQAGDVIQNQPLPSQRLNPSSNTNFTNPNYADPSLVSQYPPLKRVKYEDNSPGNQHSPAGYAIQSNTYYQSMPSNSPPLNTSNSTTYPISPSSFMSSANCNLPTNQIALNKECALHLAKRVSNDLNVLIKFVSALEGDYIPNQTHLFTAKQAVSKFTESLQASQSPTFRDDPPQTDLSSTVLEDYTLLDTLGTGTFGRVRLCKYNITNEYFCVKILSKEKVVRLKQQEHVKSEKSILLQCKHPFIVKLYTTFQDEKNLYFIMEYISGGELFTVIKKTGGLNTNVARIYAAEIILVIEYLHQRNIIHRDLKPENVLIDKLGHLKLTDFGFAKFINNDKTWTMCGTPEYIAPEIILSKGHGKCVDWWSLGVLLYEMLAGHPPFQGDNNYSVFQNILSGEVVIPPHFDPSAADLITKLLSLDITQRLGCMKGGASEVKNHRFFAGVDWDALYHKRCWGPIHPKVGYANDTSNFLNDEADFELSNTFTGDQNIFKEF